MEPTAMRFHLGAELLTAGAWIASGIGLLTGALWGPGLGLFAFDALIYSVINSPGYFAQRREWRLIGMSAGCGCWL
jgi:hypothetical protein